MAAPSTGLVQAQWRSWAEALLAAINAPVNQTNLDTLWRWTSAEGTFGRASWNFLDTTQGAPGSSNFNSVGVKSYPSADVGVRATAQTLQNGRYPNILTMLRQSVPANQWNARSQRELSVWGTGPGFLASSAGAPNVTGPVTTGSSGIDLNPLDAVSSGLKAAGDVVGSAIGTGVSGIIAAGEILLGAVLVLAGVGLLAVAVLKGSGAAGTVARAIPAGRAVGAATRSRAATSQSTAAATKPKRAVTISSPADPKAVGGEREAAIVDRVARKSEARRMAEAEAS
jgi:hypothetical protein